MRIGTWDVKSFAIRMEGVAWCVLAGCVLSISLAVVPATALAEQGAAGVGAQDAAEMQQEPQETPAEKQAELPAVVEGFTPDEGVPDTDPNVPAVGEAPAVEEAAQPAADEASDEQERQEPLNTAAETSADTPVQPSVSYQAHVQNIGWQEPVSDGTRAGTEGESLRMEAVRINLVNANGGVRYKAHVQNIGWQDWVANGAEAGTHAQSLRVEAIRVELTGAIATDYDIWYRVHVQNVGWMGWAKDGELAGSAGFARRIEALEVELRKKADIEPVSSDQNDPSAFLGGLTYQAHVQNVGWQKATRDKGMAGTSGRALRVEGIRIALTDATDGTVSGGISYRTHVQNIGWQDWKANGALAGTTGRALRLEAIQVQLTGAAASAGDVYYRAHVQNEGWLGWAKNGEVAGSTGHGLRMEALQLCLVPKGAPAPGFGTDHDATAAIDERALVRAGGLTGAGVPTVSIDLANTTLFAINAGSKDTKYPGNSLTLLDADGRELLSAADVEIKGRGNFTWTRDKKPYQIKFDKKTDLFGMGKSKKWVLLANAVDPSGLRNDVALDVAEATGLNTASGQTVNLVVDGAYVGMYYLTHKVELGKATLDLDSDDAVLMEVDNINWEAEDPYFVSALAGTHVALKDANEGDDQAILNKNLQSFQTAYNHLEAAAARGDVQTAVRYADLDSFARYYLISELAANADSSRSSYYLHRDGDGDVIHAGPAWDYDVGFGNEGRWYGDAYQDPEQLWWRGPNAGTGIPIVAGLLQNDSFVQTVSRVWRTEVAPAVRAEIAGYDASAATIRQAAIRNNAHWNTRGFTTSATYLKSWLERRYSCLQRNYG